MQPRVVFIDPEDSGSAVSTLTTAGDLLGYNTSNARIPIGADGTVLTVDLSEPTKMRWTTVPTANWDRNAGSGYVYPTTLTDKVGIGTNTPTDTLQLQNVGAVAHGLKVTNLITGANATDGFDVGIAGDGSAEIRQRENLDLKFFVNNTNWVTLKSTGEMETAAGYDALITDRDLITKSYGDTVYAPIASATTYDLTEATSSVLTITGGTDAVLSACSIQVKQASFIQDGYLSSADWNAFNNKQAGDATLTALAGMSADGVVCYKSGSDSVYNRTLTGTANQITVGEGTGAAGNPTFSLPTNVYLSDGIASQSNIGFNSSNYIQFDTSGKTYIKAGGTNAVYIDASGNTNVLGGKELRLNNNAGDNYTGLKVASLAASSVTFTLPSVDGTSGQILGTDASGNLGWYDNAGVSNGVTSTSTITDNVLVRGDGGSRGVQGSGITIDDSNNITGVGSLAITSGTISTTPSSGTDIVNYDFVIGLIGSTFWNNVACASTANIDIATDLENGDTIDGYSLVTGDRVLLKDQTDASENGLYVVVASGAASRATDADSASEVNERKAIPLNGTANAGKLYYTTSTVVTLDTDDISFAEINCSGGTLTSVSAGNGMDFVTFTDSGAIVMGTPSTLTSATLNGLTATSHTHEITTGIADTNIVKIDALAGASDDEYARFTASGLESRSVAEVKSDLSLNNVENTALSTWTGTENIDTVGIVTTGTWNAGIIAHEYGGLEADVSGYEGLIRISLGSTSNIGLGNANGYVPTIDDLLVANGDYARFTLSGIEGVTGAALLADIGAAPTGDYLEDSEFGSVGIMVAKDGLGTYETREIKGTPNQITVADGTGASADPTISLPTEVYLGAGKIGRDADNLIDFSTDNQITGRVNGADAWETSSTGDFTILASNSLKMADALGNKIEIKPQIFTGGDFALTLPAVQADTNQILQADSSGELSWQYQEITKEILCVNSDTDLAIEDNMGNAFWTIVDFYKGWKIVGVTACVTEASDSGDLEFQIEKNGTDLLTTKITIDEGEKTSDTAETAPVIDALVAILSIGDEFTFNCDANGAHAKGCQISLLLRK